MSKRGENITKRKDGRWEARVLKGYYQDGRALYKSLYAPSYSEAKRKKTEYGTYLITFSAKDFAGNEFEYAYYVNVVDTVAPVITLPDNVVTEGKVNKTITLSKATVSDNVEGEIKLTVYVYSPSMVMYELKNGDYSFKTNKAGKYQIVYVAVDAAGNYALKTVTLTVTE